MSSLFDRLKFFEFFGFGVDQNGSQLCVVAHTLATLEAKA